MRHTESEADWQRTGPVGQNLSAPVLGSLRPSASKHRRAAQPHAVRPSSTTIMKFAFHLCKFTINLMKTGLNAAENEPSKFNRVRDSGVENWPEESWRLASENVASKLLS